MEYIEHFTFTFSAHMRHPIYHDKSARISIEATDRKALQEVFNVMLRKDSDGTIREMLTRAMLVPKNDN